MGGPGSGGARVRSGPPKKPGALRRGNAGDDLKHLPPEGRAGDPPPCPLSRPTKFERDKWERDWRRPQAVAWEREGLEDLVAMYVREYARAMGPKHTTKDIDSARLLADMLGLTTSGLAKNGWAIAPAPVATGQVRPAGSSAKDRLRSIQGGRDAAAS